MTPPPAPRPVALVTGGSGDLGRAICDALANEGYFIAVHCHRHADRAAASVDAIREAGGASCAYEADLLRPDAAESLVARVIADQGSIELLVNNAGIVRDGLLFTMTDEDVDLVIDLNLKVAFRLTRVAARHMMRQKDGVIINVSSAAASKPNRGQSNYAAAKAGLEGFTRAMAVELASKGIRVNAVAPGVIESEMTRPLREVAADQILARIPLGRFGAPADVAEAVRFLASPSARYITGEVLHVDGGLR